MPELDTCINSLYFPGNIPASHGADPVEINNFTPSLDFSDARNSQNIPVVT